VHGGEGRDHKLLNIAQEQYTGGSVADMWPGPGLDENFARTDTSGSYAMLSDALGSTIGLVNSSGAIGTGYEYGPFGQTTMTGASSTNPFQYTGREMDSTGLYYMRARYYNPIAQRFISQDLIGLSGGQVNLNAYVFNNPINFVDPLGLSGGGGAFDEMGYT
jgi:RHS repeat-associated protein